jgi:hypothetical protein
MNSLNNTNLIEFGSNVNILATAICDFSTTLKDYKTGDVVLNLTDVNMLTSFRENNSEATSKKRILDYGTLNVSNLNIPYIQIDYQICNLLGDINKDFSIVNYEQLECMVENSLLLKFFTEDVDSIKVVGVNNFAAHVNAELQTVILLSDEFIEGNCYTVQYNTIINRPSIVLDSFDVDIPYLKLQISTIGNLDKEDYYSYIIVPKAKLHFSPNMNFDNYSISSCSLTFNVIDDEEESKPLLVI